MIVPYRITPEDLVDLDTKTRNALIPLLDALNKSLNPLIAQAQSTQRFKELSSTFISGATGTAFVDFNPRPELTAVRSLVVDQLRRADNADMTTAFSMSWTLTGTGVVRALFAGLDASASYFLAVTLK